MSRPKNARQKGSYLMSPPDNDERAVGERPLLEVRNLHMQFPIRRGMFRRTVGFVRAVNDVSFSIRLGETLSLVGESGCGKTTTGRCIVRVYKPSAGQIEYQAGEQSSVDLAQLDNRALRPYRRQIRMIFQDPFSSLNPRLPILQIVGESLKVNGIASGSELEERVASLLKRVGLRPEYIRRYPHAFSGGERQRIGIARALALNPRLIVADEAVSALDVSVQAQILNLMQDLQEEFNLTYLFIAHDLSVVEHISHRVRVMYVGKIVELANTERTIWESAASLHRSAAVGCSQARPAPAKPRRAHPAGRRSGRPQQPPERLLFSSPLPLRPRPLPERRAGCARDRKRSLGGVPLCRGTRVARL